MRFSFILTTQGNRLHEFMRFINGIKDNSYDIELILIDQSEDEIIKRNIETDINVKSITKIIRTKKLPLSEARNIGLKYATGDIIAFPDDDCWYGKNLLASIANTFFNNPDLNVVCTNIYDPIEKKHYGKRRKVNENTIKIDCGNIFRFPISVGIFIKCKNINDLYFNENLGAGHRWGSGEETDLLLRLLEKSYKIKFFSEINVYHPVKPYDECDIQKYMSYSMGFGAAIAMAVQRKQYLVIFEFLNISIRSLSGMLLYFVKKDNTKYKIYANRLRGSILGYKEASKKNKQNSSTIISRS